MATYKILVIDDSKVIQMRVKDMLKEMVNAGKCKILEAQDGIEGLNLIGSENPNLIMLDFFLPKMSGLEVYQEIRKQTQFKTIPLVIMSGRKEEVAEKLPHDFDYFAFVEKPFDQQQLFQGIRDARTKASKMAKFAAIPQAESKTGSDTGSAQDAEIARLKAQMNKMQSEIDQLRKDFSKLVKFLKQKIQ